MTEKTFEQLYAALEEKSRKLEQGNLPLEASLKLYEEGAAIADDLRKILEGAELKVKTLHVRLEDDRAQIREVEADYDGEPDGESSEYEE